MRAAPPGVQARGLFVQKLPVKWKGILFVSPLILVISITAKPGKKMRGVIDVTVPFK